MARLVIFANPDKPEAPRLAAEAEREAGALGAEVFVSTRLDDALYRFRPDLAAVFGGDGTVLAAVAGLGAEPPPIVAFNLGHLGYLANNPPERANELIREALESRLQASPRMMIEATLASPRRAWRRSALNEFTLSPRQRGRQPAADAVGNDDGGRRGRSPPHYPPGRAVDARSLPLKGRGSRQVRLTAEHGMIDKCFPDAAPMENHETRSIHA